MLIRCFICMLNYTGQAQKIQQKDEWLSVRGDPKPWHHCMWKVGSAWHTCLGISRTNSMENLASRGRPTG